MEQDLQIEPVGTELLYQDDDMRVWRLALEPGAETSMHQHPCDYSYVVVHGGDTETHYADGRVLAVSDETGRGVFHEAGIPHMLRNVGSTRYVNVIVEFLGLTR